MGQKDVEKWTAAVGLQPAIPKSDRLLASASPFHILLHWSDWLWGRSASTHRLTPEMLVDHLFAYLSEERAVAAATCRAALLADYLDSGARARPQVLRDLLPAHATPVRALATALQPTRQRQHQADATTRAQHAEPFPTPI